MFCRLLTVDCLFHGTEFEWDHLCVWYAALLGIVVTDLDTLTTTAIHHYSNLLWRQLSRCRRHRSAAEEHRTNAKEPVLLHVCSFSQYIYRAAELDLMVASSLSREVAVPLRKSVSRTRRTLPHEASLQERSWQEHRALCPCQTDSLALDGAILWMMRFG